MQAGALWIIVLLVFAVAAVLFIDNRPSMPQDTSGFSLTSPAFKPNGIIPSRYTCDGDRELSPPLALAGVPEGTRSLALLMDDPDIPQAVKDARGIDVFDHWVLYNIPADTRELPEGADVGVAGLNGAGSQGYVGPCPPPEFEPKEHRYIFTLYALSGELAFNEPPTKQQVLDALEPMRIGKAELIGRYARE